MLLFNVVMFLCFVVGDLFLRGVIVMCVLLIGLMIVLFLVFILVVGMILLIFWEVESFDELMWGDDVCGEVEGLGVVE